MSRAVLCLMLAAFAASPACAAAAADEVADAFNILYGDDLKRILATPDKADDIVLAAKLIAAARVAAKQPALAALLCDKAYELGMSHPSGYLTADEAMQLLADQAPERAAGCWDRIVALWQLQFDAAHVAARSQAGEDLIGALVAAAESRAAAGDSAGAGDLCKRALAIAGSIKSENAAAVQMLVTRNDVRARAEKQAADLKARLGAARDDAARRELLKLYLIELDNPAEAFKCLTGDADDATRKYLSAAAKGVDAAPAAACVELARWYAGLVASASATARAALTERAAAYYRRFLGLRPSDEATVARAREALGELRDGLAKLRPEIRPPGLNLLAEMEAVEPTTAKAVAGGVELTCKTDTGRFWTRSKFKPPFQAEFFITLQPGDPAQPDKTCSVRLHYGPTGQLMFNWEGRPDDLQAMDITTGRGATVKGKCRIPFGKPVLITWIVRPGEMQVLMNGQELLAWAGGTCGGVESPIDITASRGSVVTVRSVVVRKLRK